MLTATVPAQREPSVELRAEVLNRLIEDATSDLASGADRDEVIAWFADRLAVMFPGNDDLVAAAALALFKEGPR